MRREARRLHLIIHRAQIPVKGQTRRFNSQSVIVDRNLVDEHEKGEKGRRDYMQKTTTIQTLRVLVDVKVSRAGSTNSAGWMIWILV